MDLLLAIQKYCDKLIEYGFYPHRRPNVDKLERMADLCVVGKFRKLSRYVSKEATDEQRAELDGLMNNIKEIVENEKKQIN